MKVDLVPQNTGLSEFFSISIGTNNGGLDLAFITATINLRLDYGDGNVIS